MPSNRVITQVICWATKALTKTYAPGTRCYCYNNNKNTHAYAHIIAYKTHLQTHVSQAQWLAHKTERNKNVCTAHAENHTDTLQLMNSHSIYLAWPDVAGSWHELRMHFKQTHGGGGGPQTFSGRQRVLLIYVLESPQRSIPEVFDLAQELVCLPKTSSKMSVHKRC